VKDVLWPNGLHDNATLGYFEHHLVAGSDVKCAANVARKGPAARRPAVV
jgi:hypothetical protein